MLEVREEEATEIAAARALRDLADLIEAGGPAEPVVCVIGHGDGRTVYVLGGDTERLLTETSAFLGGIVDALPMANQRSH